MVKIRILRIFLKSKFILLGNSPLCFELVRRPQIPQNTDTSLRYIIAEITRDFCHDGFDHIMFMIFLAMPKIGFRIQLAQSPISNFPTLNRSSDTRQPTNYLCTDFSPTYCKFSCSIGTILFYLGTMDMGMI